jgi:cell division inhibitor SepF
VGKIDSFLEKIGIKDTDVDEVLLDTVEEEEVDRPVPPRAKPAEPVSFGSRRSMHDRKVINMGSDSISIREGGAAAWLAGTLVAPSLQGRGLPPLQKLWSHQSLFSSLL